MGCPDIFKYSVICHCRVKMVIDFYTANDTDTGIMGTVSELGHSLILGLEASLTWVTPKFILTPAFLAQSSSMPSCTQPLHRSSWERQEGCKEPACPWPGLTALSEGNECRGSRKSPSSSHRLRIHEKGRKWSQRQREVEGREKKVQNEPTPSAK